MDGYLETLKKAVSVRGESLHISRLRRALRFLQSGGRVDDLDQELRSLADDDVIAAEADYGMVKMFIWAIPILGFLGTVINQFLKILCRIPRLGKSAGTLQESQFIVIPPGDDGILMHTVQRTDQFHPGEVFTVELRRHGLHLSAIKQP